LWFWHVLALALGGRTVREWQSVMTREDFLTWVEFYKMAPFDDLHRYHRPAAMTAAAMGGASVADRLDWLCPEPKAHDYSMADLNTLKAFGFKPPKG
jgi:hypothetical protein